MATASKVGARCVFLRNETLLGMHSFSCCNLAKPEPAVASTHYWYEQMCDVREVIGWNSGKVRPVSRFAQHKFVGSIPSNCKVVDQHCSMVLAL
jgi:hypothetical protein